MIYAATNREEMMFKLISLIAAFGLLLGTATAADASTPGRTPTLEYSAATGTGLPEPLGRHGELLSGGMTETSGTIAYDPAAGTFTIDRDAAYVVTFRADVDGHAVPLRYALSVNGHNWHPLAATHRNGDGTWDVLLHVGDTVAVRGHTHGTSIVGGRAIAQTKFTVTERWPVSIASHLVPTRS